MLGVRVFLVVVVSLVLFGFSATARADFAVCNKTKHATDIAIGYFRSGAWISEGWWRVQPKRCQTILRGKLRSTYYYLRAVHMGVEGDWDGNRTFCVAAKNFTIKGRVQCAKRGFGQAGFFEIDTAKETTWVQNLSD